MINLLNKSFITALSFLFFIAISPVTSAAENPFGMSDLSTDQIQLSGKDGKCGDSKKEAKCGEGKCGDSKKEAKDGKCGEGKCGDSKKEGKCGESKSDDSKKAGKCGEGKCGGK